MEVVKNINLVLSTDHPQEVLGAFSTLPEVEVVQSIDKVGGRTVLLSGIEVDLRIVSDQAFPFAMFSFTGSLAHWTSMLERAKSMGLTLSEEGLLRSGRPISCREEEGVFNALGLDFIAPELRENQGEIEASEIHRLPRLVEEHDIKGIFHVHSSPVPYEAVIYHPDGLKNLSRLLVEFPKALQLLALRERPEGPAKVLKFEKKSRTG